MFNNRYISYKYTRTLKNKFDKFQEILETLAPNGIYENLTNVHMDVAAECIPTKLRAKRRVPWETLTVKKKSDAMKKVSLFNERNPTNANAKKKKNKKVQSELIHT